jgi:Papain fold toxin 2
LDRGLQDSIFQGKNYIIFVAILGVFIHSPMNEEEETNLTDKEIYQQVGNIVNNFKLLECDKCAMAVIEWLKENSINGTLLRLKTKYDGEDFILSERLERFGIGESITRNGIHYGVEVRGKIFDNLSKQGMLREDWIKDFHSLSDEFEVMIVEEF